MTFAYFSSGRMTVFQTASLKCIAVRPNYVSNTQRMFFIATCRNDMVSDLKLFSIITHGCLQLFISLKQRPLTLYEQGKICVFLLLLSEVVRFCYCLVSIFDSRQQYSISCNACSILASSLGDLIFVQMRQSQAYDRVAILSSMATAISSVNIHNKTGLKTEPRRTLSNTANALCLALLTLTNVFSVKIIPLSS